MFRTSILSTFLLATLAIAVPTTSNSPEAQNRPQNGAYVSLFNDFECADPTDNGYLYVGHCQMIKNWGFQVEELYSKDFEGEPT
jgi:hypothetical protein